MQSLTSTPTERRPGRKPYPLSANQRRDERALHLYTLGLTARDVMLRLNRESEVECWPPIDSERTAYRIVRNELVRKQVECSPTVSDDPEREAALSRMDATLEMLSVHLMTNNEWAPWEELQAHEMLLRWQIQQAQNRGLLDVPFKVQWQRFPKVTRRHTRVLERASTQADV